MTAVRLARGATGRSKILKFAGGYHGHVDARCWWRPGAALPPPGAARLGRGHRGDRRRHHRGALQRRRRARRGVRALGRCTGGGAGGAGRRQHGPRRTRRRIPRRPAPPLHRRGRAPRVRRGDHRVPARTGGRARVLRHHARPLDVRQGGGRRPAARRARRARRRDGPARAARPGVPSRHVVGEPARHRGRPRGAVAARRRRVRRAHQARAPVSATACARVHERRRRRTGHAGRHAHRALLRLVTRHRLRHRARPITRRTVASSTRCSTAACSSHRVATRPCSSASPTTTTPSTKRSPPHAKRSRSCAVSDSFRLLGCETEQMPESWTIQHFSQANPAGEGQAMFRRSLRRVPDTIQQLGDDVRVQDITFSTEMTGDGPWHSMTAYFHFDWDEELRPIE